MTARIPALPRRGERFTLAAAALVMGCWLALLWVLEIVDAVTGSALDTFGVSPRDPGELPQIFTAPLLHHGWNHLLSNSVPFLCSAW